MKTYLNNTNLLRKRIADMQKFEIFPLPKFGAGVECGRFEKQ